MKTIADLNSKWLYRLTKVLYVLFGILLITTVFAINFSAVGSYQTDFLVKCNYGNESSFLAYKDEGLYIPLGDYTTSLTHLPDYLKGPITNICEMTEEEQRQKFDSYLDGTDDGKKLFDLTVTKVPVATYLTATAWSVAWSIGLLLLLEIIRRLFYYILFGRFFPSGRYE